MEEVPAVTDEGFELVTKANGQVVKVYPDGRKYLVSPNDPVLSRLNSEISDRLAEDESLKNQQIENVEKKKSELDSNGLPAEKRPL